MPTADWTCPKCKRQFARAKQAHSCQVVSLDGHLARASPATRKIFEAILRFLGGLGPLQVAPTKTSINLLSGTSLGSISIQHEQLTISFVLTKKASDPRLSGVLQLSPNSVVHRIRIASLAEFDTDVKDWLRQAYQVGLMKGRR